MISKPIKLVELLHSISEEEKDGLVNIDDWRYPDVDHLISMGFEFGDDFHLNTTKDPKISVYKKKEADGESKDKTECFYVEEKDRGTKKFKSFGDVIDYFDTYSPAKILTKTDKKDILNNIYN